MADPSEPAPLKTKPWAEVRRPPDDRRLPPGKAEETFRKATGAWPPDDDRLDPELHRLFGCPCSKPAEPVKR